jgi:hypothetical protein
MSAHLRQPFPWGDEFPCPLYRRLGEPQGRSGRCTVNNTLAIPAIEPPIPWFNPYGRCTHWTPFLLMDSGHLWIFERNSLKNRGITNRLLLYKYVIGFPKLVVTSTVKFWLAYLLRTRTVEPACDDVSPGAGERPLSKPPPSSVVKTVTEYIGLCDIDASLREREPRSRGTSTVGSRHQAALWRPWLSTLVFVT